METYKRVRMEKKQILYTNIFDWSINTGAQNIYVILGGCITWRFPRVNDTKFGNPPGSDSE